MPNFVTAHLSNNAESCILRYTTSDNKMLYLSPYDFGAEKIVSHTYNNGEGQVIFNTPIWVISKFASSNCSLTSINIPDGVTEIWAYAFSNFKHLRSITIPNSVTKIGESAFYNCSSLRSITIPNSVIEIENSAFNGCDSLRSISIPNSVTKIGRGAFAYCKSLSAFYGKFASADNRCLIVDGVLNSFALAGLTEYTIPNSVTKIGDSAFCYCKSLTSVTIPNSVIEIENSAFNGCASLRSITIPDSVTKIGDSAFDFCESLTNVTIPDSVTKIGESAFYNCSSLRSITIPNSVIEIENSAFNGCDSLRSISIPNSVTKIGRGAFAYCKSLSAFYGKFASADNRCLIVDGVLNSFAPAGLTEYTIPDSVIVIAEETFASRKSLTSVTIPNSVTEIGDRAFIGCSSLQTIICKPTTPPILGLGAFHDVHSNATIIFPEGCKEAYMSSDWRRALL